MEGLADTLERVSTVWSESVSDRKMPIMVGGEHSITKAVFDDLKTNDVGLLSFDAHLDLRDEFLGEKLSHATFMRRIVETIGPDHLMEVGIRAFTRNELDYCRNSHVGLVYVKDIRKSLNETMKKINDFVSSFKRMYVTVDIDVLDPAFAPGVGNPEADGITTDELLTLVTKVLDKNTVGFDLVEVCPPLDSGQTAAVAAKVIFETMAKLHNA
jgi:agmatinase